MDMLWSNFTRQGRRGVPKVAMVLTAAFLVESLLAPASLYGQSVNFAGMQSTVSVNGLNEPFGVAVDATGDLFITDNSGAVIKVPAGGGPQTTLPNLNTPMAVAVDALGNVFATDSFSAPPRIVEIPANSSTTITLPTTGLQAPDGIAVDSAGNLFITDDLNGTVVEILAGSGSQITLANNLVQPQSIAVDASGNLFCDRLLVGGPRTGNLRLVVAYQLR